jgi:hypothetical protein
MKQAFPRRFQLLAAMNEARGRGDLETFYRLQDEHLRELTGRPGRPTLDSLEARVEAATSRIDAMVQPKDKDPKTAKEGDGIDWPKVAREAQTMVDLNRVATEAWQGSRKGAKGEEG